MPVYSIEGIEVRFPFEAYESQLSYMKHVISALKNGKNALLESPTGTGKTLCLLCSTLAWRESLKNSFNQNQLQLFQSYTSSQSLKKDSFKDDFVNKDDNDDVNDVDFSSLPTIIYSSRTHSQIQQVIRELKHSGYKPKMCVLGSREQMCIHDTVKTYKGHAQNLSCRKMTKSNSCQHHAAVSSYIRTHPEFETEISDIEDLVNFGKQNGPCPYYHSREKIKNAEIIFMPYNYIIEKELRNKLKNIEWKNSVVIFDEAHNIGGICSDSSSVDISELLLSNCIHECEKCINIAREKQMHAEELDDAYDPINYHTLQKLIELLLENIKSIEIKSEFGLTKPGEFIFEFLEKLNITKITSSALIDTLEHAILLLTEDAESKGINFNLQKLCDIFETIFEKSDLSHASSYRVHIHEERSQNKVFGKTVKGKDKGRLLSWWCLDPGISMAQIQSLKIKSFLLTSGTLSPLSSFSKELKINFDVQLENPHVIKSNQILTAVLSNGPSGKRLNSSYQNRNTVEYKQELGNAIVNFCRIIPDGLLVFFPSYVVLDTCISYWKSVPIDGQNSIWERICKHKFPVIESRESASLNLLNQEFLSKINDKSNIGSVFFAVCRGKVSEGIDFADRAGRGVIITGIPYATMIDPKVKLKRDYLDEKRRNQKKNENQTLSGEEWYVLEGIRSVNQAIGRVIRHSKDYGVILLCDERFSNFNIKNQLSKWLKPYVKVSDSFGEIVFSLTKFFQSKNLNFDFDLKKKSSQSQSQSQEALTDNLCSKFIQFEEENENSQNNNNNNANNYITQSTFQNLFFNSKSKKNDSANVHTKSKSSTPSTFSMLEASRMLTQQPGPYPSPNRTWSAGRKELTGQLRLPDHPNIWHPKDEKDENASMKSHELHNEFVDTKCIMLHNITAANTSICHVNVSSNDFDFSFSSSRKGQTSRTSQTSQRSQTDRTTEMNRTSQRSLISQTGQTSQTNEVNQMGQMGQTGQTIGKGQSSRKSQNGQTSQTSQTNQTCQRDRTLYNHLDAFEKKDEREKEKEKEKERRNETESTQQNQIKLKLDEVKTSQTWSNSSDAIREVCLEKSNASECMHLESMEVMDKNKNNGRNMFKSCNLKRKASDDLKRKRDDNDDNNNNDNYNNNNNSNNNGDKDDDKNYNNKNKNNNNNNNVMNKENEKKDALNMKQVVNKKNNTENDEYISLIRELKSSLLSKEFSKFLFLTREYKKQSINKKEYLQKIHSLFVNSNKLNLFERLKNVLGN